MNFSEDRLSFEEKDKVIKLIVSEGGHSLVRLELVGTWNDDEAVLLVKDEKSVTDVKGTIVSSSWEVDSRD